MLQNKDKENKENKENKRNNGGLTLDKRVSNVQHVNIVSIDQTSVLQIGDSQRVTPTIYGIAVQREKAIFGANEMKLCDYPIFCNTMPKPQNEENIEMVRQNNSPYILVENIEIIVLAFSCIVHVGSSEALQSESRIKNIRHFLKPPVVQERS